MTRPNVMVVVLDTARADAFEPYGAPAGSSPTIAALARAGTAHPRAYAACSWTLPSHVSMFTGLLPREAGLGRSPGPTPAHARSAVQRHAPHFLPEVLRRAGYATFGVSANLWISGAGGWDTGFEAFHSVATQRQSDLSGNGWRGRTRWLWEAAQAHRDDGAAAALGLMQTSIRSWSGRPTFWFVNLVECHSPYLPPRPWNDLGLVSRLKAADEARRHLTLDAMWRASVGGFDVPDEALHRMRYLYARSVRSMDEWLAAILEELQQKGILDETLLIVTSDHGENLGEQGLMGHAFSLDNRLVHVPFVASGPGAPAAGGVLSLADLPRQISAAIELSSHPWGESPVSDGVAVSQYDPPLVPAEARAAWVTEQRVGDEGLERMTTSLTSAVDGRFKLVRRGTNGDERLFDLHQDPLEEEPLVDAALDDAGRAARGRLHGAIDACRGPDVVNGDGVPQDLEVDPDLERQMKLLGYM